MRTRTSWILPVAVSAAALAAVAVLPATAAAAAAPAARAVAAPAEGPTYLVTVHRGLDPAAVADAHGITPLHVYREVLHGFAARLSPEQVASLRASAVVEAVEEDGAATSFGPAL
ncbi:protease inhibitor I9 family protein [Streptomyces sp. NPDC091268]|uniref:protease inhibitor I9 family protein n=1 Tax=Streptomyces sp. NPDC091268 TaxID=3365979 RepID=UPI0037FDD6CB